MLLSRHPHGHLEGRSMRFNPKARIDSGKVSDAGGGGGGGGLGGGGGGMRLPIPTGAGGGKLGLLIAVIFFVVAMCNGNVPGINQGDGGGTQNNATANDPEQQQADEYDKCLTGEDANKSEACSRKAILKLLEDYWS